MQLKSTTKVYKLQYTQNRAKQQNTTKLPSAKTQFIVHYTEDLFLPLNCDCLVITKNLIIKSLSLTEPTSTVCQKKLESFIQ